MLHEAKPLESLNCFMFKFTKTFDPLDPERPIKPLPEKPHLRDFNKAWFLRRYLAIPKSRQIHATWWAVDTYVWDSIRNHGRFTIFKSVDKQHSGMGANKLALLSRAIHIVDQLPKHIRPRVKPWKRDNILEFLDTGSSIHAMSMEGDAGVSYTATGCLDDELTIQQYGEAGFTVVLPLLGTVGKYTTLFTYRGLNFGWRLAFDKMDDTSES
jgi:hypothetical protein